MVNRLDVRLLVILDVAAAGDRSLAELARLAIAGGATMLQVRAKRVPTRTFLELVRTVLPVARPAGVPVLVNDRADVALAAGADGVHLGEEDLPIATARRILGPEALIGYSTARVDLARAAAAESASYLGVGDVFGTTSKPDADMPIGLAGLSAMVASIRLPVVAIGGVTAENAAAAVGAGAQGVAVIRAVLAADDVAAAARALRAAVDTALGDRGAGSAVLPARKGEGWDDGVG